MLLNAGLIASSAADEGVLDLTGLTIPSGRQAAVESAAETAATGQAYSAQDVIDALVACDLVFDWWNAYTDTGATTQATDTDAVAAVKDYTSGALLTQGTAGAQFAYDLSGTGGLLGNGSRYLFGSGLTYPEGTAARCIVTSITQELVQNIDYYLTLNDGGSEIEFLLDNRTGEKHFQMGTTGSLTSNIEAGSLSTGPAIWTFISDGVGNEEIFQNGSSVFGPATRLTSTANNGNITWGGNIGKDFFDGTLHQLYISPNHADRDKMERFANAIDSLSVLP